MYGVIVTHSGIAVLEVLPKTAVTPEYYAHNSPGAPQKEESLGKVSLNITSNKYTLLAEILNLLEW